MWLLDKCGKNAFRLEKKLSNWTFNIAGNFLHPHQLCILASICCHCSVLWPILSGWVGTCSDAQFPIICVIEHRSYSTCHLCIFGVETVKILGSFGSFLLLLLRFKNSLLILDGGSFIRYSPRASFFHFILCTIFCKAWIIIVVVVVVSWRDRHTERGRGRKKKGESEREKALIHWCIIQMLEKPDPARFKPRVGNSIQVSYGHGKVPRASSITCCLLECTSIGTWN